MPVRSTCYGIIETKGWNRLGGWRIGIRDLHNNYHYYAHLGGFSKEIQLRQIVEPGKVIGFVGSTGYGPPGTAENFRPTYILACIKTMAIQNGPSIHTCI